MKMKYITAKLCVSLLFITFSASCCRQKNEAHEPTEDLQLIEKTINDCIGWAKTKDINLLYSVIADSEDYLEVHPTGNVVKGISEFRQMENFWLNSDFKAVRYEIRDLKINLSQTGDVAWWFCILDDINEWKGEPASWEDTRWTGVLEKRDGKWVIAQQHFSFASQ